MRPDGISICGEFQDLRGAFIAQPSYWHEVRIGGFIERAPGQRVYVKDGSVLDELLKADSPYVLITAKDVVECTDVKLVEIESFIPLDRLESAGEMACGFG
jgi:hypothetical protein